MKRTQYKNKGSEPLKNSENRAVYNKYILLDEIEQKLNNLVPFDLIKQELILKYNIDYRTAEKLINKVYYYEGVE